MFNKSKAVVLQWLVFELPKLETWVQIPATAFNQIQVQVVSGQKHLPLKQRIVLHQ